MAKNIKDGIEWYEVRIGGMTTSHGSLEEARDELNQMSMGYPESEHMSEENHNYWKHASFNAVIIKVKQITERVL